MKELSFVLLGILAVAGCAKNDETTADQAEQAPVAVTPTPAALPAAMDPRSANPMLDKARAAVAGAEAQQQSSQAELDQVR